MSFINKLTDFLDKGVDMSRDAITKAGDVVQDMGNKGVLRIEILQLKEKQNKEYRDLGMAVAEIFRDSPYESITRDTVRVWKSLELIRDFDQQIKTREEKLKREN